MQLQLNILFVDDHSGLIRSLGATLKNKNSAFDFFYANTKNEALEILCKNEIQILVLDLNLNMENGLDFIDDFKKVSPNLKILVFTMYNDFCHIEKAYKLKVQGYITKDCEIEEFEQALLQVAEGGIYFSKSANEFVYPSLLNFMDKKETVTDSETKKYFSIYKSLTPKEKEVFELSATLKNPKEIADALGKKERTIQNQKNSIFGKFHISTNTELLKIARILGFII